MRITFQYLKEPESIISLSWKLDRYHCCSVEIHLNTSIHICSWSLLKARGVRHNLFHLLFSSVPLNSFLTLINFELFNAILNIRIHVSNHSHLVFHWAVEVLHSWIRSWHHTLCSLRSVSSHLKNLYLLNI